MTVLCHARPAIEQHKIAAGDRQINVSLEVNWGADDIRADHAKTVVFCSFACLAEWALVKAGEHDGHVLKEGT